MLLNKSIVITMTMMKNEDSKKKPGKYESERRLAPGPIKRPVDSFLSTVATIKKRKKIDLTTELEQ